MNDVTAIILTFNESLHLRRCIASLRGVAKRICVVDSFSTDNTCDIARELGADFYQNPWRGHANQFNWALDNCNITTQWVLRIDADEYIETELADSITRFLSNPSNYNSAVLKRKIVFMGKPIKHGFFYPGNILRLWRFGEGRMEQRLMDEHVRMESTRSVVLDGDLTDENLNDLSWWTRKHDGYAELESYELALGSNHSDGTGQLATNARAKRFIKNNIYYRIPPGFRAIAYFFYRYFLGLGFLDGKAGFYFHFLQAFWYRIYVDAKFYELEIIAKREGVSIRQLLKNRGVRVD